MRTAQRERPDAARSPQRAADPARAAQRHDPRAAALQQLQRGAGNRMTARSLQRWIEIDGVRYDRRNPLPNDERAKFLAHIDVAEEHRDEWVRFVDGHLNDILGQGTRWTPGPVQVALRRDWRDVLRTLPVAAVSADAAVVTAEQVYTTILKAFFTRAVVRINGQQVLAARNDTLEETHAEDEVIRELDKPGNWRTWQARGIATGAGDVVHLQLNNSPCFDRKGCGPALVAWLARRRGIDRGAHLKVSFMNPYELDRGGFAKSIAAMEGAGIQTEVVGGAPIAEAVLATAAARAQVERWYELGPGVLQRLLVDRRLSGARAAAAHTRVVSALGFQRAPAPAPALAARPAPAAASVDWRPAVVALLAALALYVIVNALRGA